MSHGSQHIRDMRYGRQGGRIVEFKPSSPARYCKVCGTQMLGGQKDRHYACNTTIVGHRCTCPPGCTTGDHWGDGAKPCDGDCIPCRLMVGQPLKAQS